MMQQQAALARMAAAANAQAMSVDDTRAQSDGKDQKNEGVKRRVDQVDAEGDVQTRQHAAPAPSTAVAVATAADSAAAVPLDPNSYGVQLGQMSVVLISPIGEL